MWLIQGGSAAASQSSADQVDAPLEEIPYTVAAIEEILRGLPTLDDDGEQADLLANLTLQHEEFPHNGPSRRTRKP